MTRCFSAVAELLVFLPVVLAYGDTPLLSKVTPWAIREKTSALGLKAVRLPRAKRQLMF